jgi:hypothetical protein
VDRWTKGRSQRLSKTVPSLNQGRKGSGARERGMMARHIKRVRSRRSPCEANGAEIHTRMYAGMRGEAGRDRRLGPFRWWEKKRVAGQLGKTHGSVFLVEKNGSKHCDRQINHCGKKEKKRKKRQRGRRGREFAVRLPTACVKLRLPKQRGERAPESGD